MADDSYRKFYRQSAFTSLLSGLIQALPLLRTTIGALSLSVPVADVRLGLLDQVVVIVEWPGLPSAADVALVDAAIASFAGGTTTSQPFEYNSFGVSTSNSSTPVTKLNNTTPLLDAGTYQVIWNALLRMSAVIANTGVEAKVRITRSDGVFVEQTDAWDLNVNHAYNGAITFQVLPGQTLTTLLTFSRLGALGTAELSGARITVDKIS